MVFRRKKPKLEKMKTSGQLTNQLIKQIFIVTVRTSKRRGFEWATWSLYTTNFSLSWLYGWETADRSADIGEQIPEFWATSFVFWLRCKNQIGAIYHRSREKNSKPLLAYKKTDLRISVTFRLSPVKKKPWLLVESQLQKNKIYMTAKPEYHHRDPGVAQQ